MRKVLMLAAVAALLVGSTALAQDSCLFFDIRNNVTAGQIIDPPSAPYIVGGQNGGKAGDAQTLWITPHVAPFETTFPLWWPNNDGDGDTHTGSLWLYMDVNLAGGGGTGVISSIGVDMPITAPLTPRNTIGSLSFTWLADPPIVWGGVANGAGGPAGWAGAKAVKVPVSGPPPVFNPAGGLVPVARYRVGRLDVVGGPRNYDVDPLHVANSTYTLKMTVNGLLITRVFNGVPPDTTENVAFGYAGGAPEAPYADGSIAGQTSALEDATIVVQMKGDTSGDGAVLNNDIVGFTDARTAGVNLTQLQAALFDASGEGVVLNNDIVGFTTARGSK